MIHSCVGEYYDYMYYHLKPIHLYELNSNCIYNYISQYTCKCDKYSASMYQGTILKKNIFTKWCITLNIIF